MRLGFIGVGNMGGAIARGCMRVRAERGEELGIFLSEHNAHKVEDLVCAGAVLCRDVAELIRRSDAIMLGVKPIAVDAAAGEMVASGALNDEKIIVSMAAGCSIEKLESFFGAESKICRIMPNTPALIGEGMISISCNANVTPAELDAVKNALAALGKIEVVDEELIHCVIGVAGSSPAYTYMYIEALASAAAAEGMTPDQALEFAAQSVLGAAKMVLETGISPEQLRINVCSPGGTTVEAVKVLEDMNFKGIVAEAFNAACEKSKLMSK